MKTSSLPPSFPPCLPAQRLTHTLLVPLFQTHENRCIISFVRFGQRLNLSSARHTRYVTCCQIAIINLSNRWRNGNSSTAHLEWTVWSVRCVYEGGSFQTLKSYEVKPSRYQRLVTGLTINGHLIRENTKSLANTNTESLWPVKWPWFVL